MNLPLLALFDHDWSIFIFRADCANAFPTCCERFRWPVCMNYEDGTSETSTSSTHANADRLGVSKEAASDESVDGLGRPWWSPKRNAVYVDK